MTYREYNEQRQQEFNALPIFYAFSNKQFEEAMNERGLECPDDIDKIRSIGAGGYIHVDDVEKLREFRRNDRLPELMKDPVFAEDAFYYEMQNHEFHINWEGAYDVCSCFGHCEYEEQAGGSYYLDKMGYGIETIQAYKRAMSRFLHDADERGWY